MRGCSRQLPPAVGALQACCIRRRILPHFPPPCRAEHAWVVRDVASARRMCLGGAQTVVATAAQAQTVTISDPPMLRWHESTHRGFLHPFRREVQQLLRCWQRLCVARSSGGSGGGGSGSGATPQAAAANLGSLPYDLVSCLGAALLAYKYTVHV